MPESRFFQTLLRFSAVALLCGVLLPLSVPTPAFAQSTASRSKPSGRAKYQTLPVTVLQVNGYVAVVKPDGDAPPVTAALTDKTRFHRVVAKTGKVFTVGEKLVLRLAFYPDGRVTVADFYDVEIHNELQRLRKETIVGTVDTPMPAGAVSGYLHVRPEEEESTIEYRVTETTLFYKNNTRVAPTAYPAGAPVAIKPRALPNGGFMARIVAESEAALDIAYKDTLTVWGGVAEQVDPSNGFVLLKRTDGVRRKVLFPRNLTITDEKNRKEKGERKLYGLAEIVGKSIIVRLVRNEKPGDNGTRSATEITVGTDTTPPVAEKEPATEKPGPSTP